MTSKLIIIAGALMLAALVAIYAFRPFASGSERRADTALERQMDRSQAASAERQRDLDAERAAAFR